MLNRDIYVSSFIRLLILLFVVLMLLGMRNINKRDDLENSQSMIEFRKFISDKYTITSKDAEDKIQSELNLDLQSVGPDAVLDAANKSYEYALNEGYDKSEDLKNAILNLSEALSKFN